MAGFVAGGVAVETGHYYLPRLFNRLTPPAAIDVVVVPDPLDYLIGDPDWTYFGFVVSETPADIGAPPERPCRNWWRWGRDLGAADANRTEFELVIIGRQDTSVVVQGLEVKVGLRDQPGGRQVLACPVGGAEGSLRHIRVNLDWPEGMNASITGRHKWHPRTPYSGRTPLLCTELILAELATSAAPALTESRRNDSHPHRSDSVHL